MTIFRKTVPTAEKKCIFIGRGNENVVLLHRSFYFNFCMLDSIHDRRQFQRAETQKIGSGNESERSGRRYDIYGDKIHETIISPKQAEGLWL